MVVKRGFSISRVGIDRNFKALVTVSALMTAGFTAAFSQEPDGDRELDRRVDVSREYLPDVDRAPKLTIAPVMSDTVALRPDLQYTVAPSPWVTGFGVSAINPVRVDAASYDPLKPFYLKAGFGFPARSLVDLYGTTTSTGGGYAGGYLNHTGRWSKLRNDSGMKERALESHNRAGIFGRTYLGSRIALWGEIGYDYDVFSMYNFIEKPDWWGDYVSGDTPLSNQLLSYSVPRIAVGIGNDFTDLSFFNFAVDAEGYLLRGRGDVKESGFKAGIAVGRIWGIHGVKIGARYDGAYGGGERKGYDVSVLSVTPEYLLDEGRFKVGVGVQVAYSKMKGESGKAYFLPRLDVSYSLYGGAFVPFGRVESRLISNSFRSIVDRNPYVVGGDAMFLHPSRDYKGFGGIRGGIGSHFSYEVRIGGGIIKDVHNFYVDNRYDHTKIIPSAWRGYFATIMDGKMKYFTAGGSLSGRVGEVFTAWLDLDYYSFDSPYADPEMVGKLHVGYNYREKLFIKLTGGLTGKRYIPCYVRMPYGEWTVLSDKLPTVFDLGIEAEYRLFRHLGIFVSGENLLNKKLYPYYGYRGFGIGVTGGVKMLF